MRRLIRPVAALLALVLLQLVLVGSGYACQMDARGAAGSASMADMRMPSSAAPASSAPAPSDQGQSPCRFPWAPNGCQSMAPCAPGALVGASTLIGSEGSPTVARWRLVQLAPPAVSHQPDIPPPRA